MGFFGRIGKGMAGKPVYEADNQNVASQPSEALETAVPVMRITKLDCHIDGQKMDIYAFIHNESAEDVCVAKAILLERNREVNDWVSPGDTKQFHIYSDNAPQDANNHEIDLQYKTRADAWFEARHEIIYRQDGGQFMPADSRLLLPIKNLYQ